METAYLTLLPILTIAVLAIYWTVFKIRKDVKESQSKIISALSEIQQALEKK